MGLFDRGDAKRLLRARQFSGAGLAAARFSSRFGESDTLELLHAGSDEVGDRLHVF
jgi:hypothetical protein